MSGIDSTYIPGVSDDGGHVAADFLAYLVFQSSEHNVTQIALKLMIANDRRDRYRYPSIVTTSNRCVLQCTSTPGFHRALVALRTRHQDTRETHHARRPRFPSYVRLVSISVIRDHRSPPLNSSPLPRKVRITTVLSPSRQTRTIVVVTPTAAILLGHVSASQSRYRL